MKLAMPFALALSVATGGAQAAAFIPVGVQNDVAFSTVVADWGWTEIYRDDGYAIVSLSEVLEGAGANVMLAGFKPGSTTELEVLAATTLTDALQYTPLNQTHLSNGARWYSNGFSLGFAGVDDAINQGAGDVGGYFERDRLSWHTYTTTPFGDLTQDAARPAEGLIPGWRHGAASLGFGPRVVFTLLPAPAVPEPATWAMMLVGFGAVGIAMRRGLPVAIA